MFGRVGLVASQGWRGCEGKAVRRVEGGEQGGVVRSEGGREGNGGRAEVARDYRGLIGEGEVEDRRSVAVSVTVPGRGQSQVLDLEAVFVHPCTEGTCPVGRGAPGHGPTRGVGVEISKQEGRDTFVEGVVEEVL